MQGFVPERFLQAILRHALRLQRLAEDLTTLAQAESLKQNFEPVQTDLRAVCRDSAGSLEGAAHAKGMTLRFQLPEEKVVVDVSPRALDHALTNLIGNAIKYSPEKTTVTIRLREDRDNAVLEVEDQGPGIPAHLRQRIFERFYRVDKARSREVGGTGLGLSIVKHFTARMGGVVGVESEPGVGTTFRVELPLALEE